MAVNPHRFFLPFPHHRATPRHQVHMGKLLYNDDDLFLFLPDSLDLDPFVVSKESVSHL